MKKTPKKAAAQAARPKRPRTLAQQFAAYKRSAVCRTVVARAAGRCENQVMWGNSAVRCEGRVTHHVVDLIDPIPVPAGWTKYAGFDWGYNHPFAFVAFCKSPDGISYLVRGYGDAERVASLCTDCARWIKRFTS